MSEELAKPGMAVFCRSFTRRMILSLGLVGLWGFAAPAAFGQNMQFENDTDRFGADSNSFAVSGGPQAGGGGGVQGTWQLTSNCPYNGATKPPWGGTITLREDPDGTLHGSMQNDPLNPYFSSGKHAGNNVTMTWGPAGWESVLQLNGTLNGSRINGRVHHYGKDDCDFTMTAAGGNNTGGGGSLNFFQNALILGVQTGFVQAVTRSNLETNPSYLSQVVPTMQSYAAALGLPHDQLDTLIGQLRSGATQAAGTIENVWNQFQQQLSNRTCMCGNYAANLKTAYYAGWYLGLAEMEAFLGSPEDLTIFLSGARANAAAVGLPTDGLDSVISRLQSGTKGCDVAQDLQNIEKQFEQLTNQPCTCMQDTNASSGSQTSPTMPGPMQPQPQPQGQGTCGSVIYQNNGTIFGGVDGHPLVVRPPGGLQARVVHLEVPAQTYLNLDAVMVFDSSGTNVALNKPASQSSRSPWTQPNGAQGGVDGHTPDGGYHIHTDQNANPSWWEVDLQQVYAIAEIRVYNRMDYRDRAAHLKICVNYQPSSNAGGTMNPSGTASSSLAGTRWAGPWIIYPWVDSTGKSTLTINADGTATSSAKSGDGRSTYSAQWWGCAVAGDQLKCKFNEHLDQPDKSADRTGTVTCTSSWDAQAGGWYLKADYAFDMPPKINWKVAPVSTPLNDPTMSVTFWRFPLGG